MAAGQWLLLLFLTQLLVDVHTYTLYQWIVDSKTRFNYDPSPMNRLGVYNWGVTYPESCGGELQSPVDIQTDRVRYRRDLSCPRMLYRSSLLRGELKNNGHSATFEPENEMSLRLTNIPYRPGIYNLNDFHLHYGGVSGRIFEIQGQRFRGSGVMSAGSEHTIDGLRFEGELHFVFYNSRYRDLEEADNKTDGVVVMSFLVQKLPDNMADSATTSMFSDFLERNIPSVAAYKQNMTLEVDLSMFFDRECQFYTYFGSTTTPVCHESVQWFILREPIRVTERAWFQLTRLQSVGDFNRPFGNYRTTQPVNNRVVEANFPRLTGPVLPSPNSDIVRPRSETMPMADVPPSNQMSAGRPPFVNRNMSNMPFSDNQKVFQSANMPQSNIMRRQGMNEMVTNNLRNQREPMPNGKMNRDIMIAGNQEMSRKMLNNLDTNRQAMPDQVMNGILKQPQQVRPNDPRVMDNLGLQRREIFQMKIRKTPSPNVARQSMEFRPPKLPRQNINQRPMQGFARNQAVSNRVPLRPPLGLKETLISQFNAFDIWQRLCALWYNQF